MSEMTGSILDLNFDDVYDFETLPDSSEAQLRVTAAEVYRKEGGTRSNLHITFDDPSNDRVQDIHLYMGLPIDEDEPKRVNKMKLRIKAFYEAVGADMSGPIELQDMIGETLTAIVGEEDDPEYGKRNFIRSFVTPR